MPYFSRRTRRRFRKAYAFGKKQYRNRAKWQSTAQKALSVALAAKSMLNVEHKFYDSSIGVAADDTYSSLALTNPAQGDTTQTRDGNSIKLTSLYITGDIELQTTYTPRDRVRCVLVHSLHGNSPSWTSVFLDDDVNSMRNLNNTHDFKVLWDRTYNLSTYGGDDVKTLKCFKKFNNHHVKWDAGTVNARNGHLYFLYLGGHTGSAATHVDFKARARFIDN